MTLAAAFALANQSRATEHRRSQYREVTRLQSFGSENCEQPKLTIKIIQQTKIKMQKEIVCADRYSKPDLKQFPRRIWEA